MLGLTGLDVCIVRSVITHGEVYQAVGDGMPFRRVLCYSFNNRLWPDAKVVFECGRGPCRLHARPSLFRGIPMSSRGMAVFRSTLLWLGVWGSGPLVFSAGAVAVHDLFRDVWGIHVGWVASALVSAAIVSVVCLFLLWLLCRKDGKRTDR